MLLLKAIARFKKKSKIGNMHLQIFLAVFLLSFLALHADFIYVTKQNNAQDSVNVIDFNNESNHRYYRN